MVNARPLRLGAALIALVAAATPAVAGTVRHVPPAEATPGAPIQLSVEVARAWESSLRVHFRPLGATSWQSAEFRRDGDHWIATIPAQSVQAPGVEYYLDARSSDGAVAAEFASAVMPHRVLVEPDPVVLRRQRELDRYAGRRSRLHGAIELVDYGSRRLALAAGDRDVNDRYYRVDADFSYLLLRYPLKALRIGYTRLLGTTPDTNLDDPSGCPATGNCEVTAGFKVGGWFELRFAPRDGIELDVRGAAMATGDGFRLGGRSELRLGVEDGSHVAVGGEVLADVGSSAFFRLGWATVPGLPMAATVEVSDYPLARRAHAVRLLYDIAHPFPNGLRAGVRIGYQARDELVGGLSAGLNASVDF